MRSVRHSKITRSNLYVTRRDNVTSFSNTQILFHLTKFTYKIQYYKRVIHFQRINLAKSRESLRVFVNDIQIKYITPFRYSNQSSRRDTFTYRFSLELINYAD